jgi:xanthine/uracil permease
MKNRTKIAAFIMLFWVLLQIALRLIGFSSIPVFIFTIIGYVISNLIGMCLDTHNEKVNRWFDSTKFFKM